jgi:hypothetical protein
MTDSKQPGVVFWATVALVVGLVLYTLSIGPVNWVNERHTLIVDGDLLVNRLYFPITELRDRSPKPIRSVYWWYMSLWVECGPHD